MTSAAPLLGPCVFELVLPLELAPTLNVYASERRMPGWRKKKIATAIDWKIVEAKSRWIGWSMGVVRDMAPTKTGRPGKASGGRPRAIVVTRHSSVQPDEMSVDVIGGKCCVDRLVRANVLRDDSPAWCRRVAAWERAAPGVGRLVVAVFEVEGEG